MLHIVVMSEKFLLQFGLEKILMPNSKHEDLPKFLFLTGSNSKIYWMIYKKNAITKPINSTLHGKPIFRTTFLNALIIIKKNESKESVLDAKRLNSNTDTSH